MNKILLIISLIFVLVLSAEISDPVVAVSSQGDDNFLVYDQEKGIIRDGASISLCCWRNSIDNARVYDLLYVYSLDNGETYTEEILQQYDLTNAPGEELFFNKRFSPVILKGADNELLVFFLNLSTTQQMVAHIEVNGTIISIEQLDINRRSQMQYVNGSEEILIAGLSGDVYEKPLSRFQYFTNHEYSENDEYQNEDMLKFWYNDEFVGKLHSNDDIWIQHSGGGGNNGWPLFHEMVTTDKRIRVYPSGEPAVNVAPMDEIFAGGWVEESGFLSFSSQATEVIENGLFLEESSNHDILYVTLEGTSALCRYGDRVAHIDTFIVYNSFPDQIYAYPIGDSIWTNEVGVPEIEWDNTTFNISIVNNSVFVDCQLWIEGTVSGYQTWASSDTIFITNALLYDTTIPGDMPEPDSPDMLGLISEERIFVQYKNYNPNIDAIQSPNCDDVYLYGSFAAIGDGDIDIYGNMNTHYEGIFSFYYQHPHGSTPGFTLTSPSGSIEVEYPDLHRYIFPPSPYWTGDPEFLMHGADPVSNNGFYTSGYPGQDPYIGGFPTGTDWPWYNPVYPEGACAEMGERGSIYLYGAIQQYRRGFTHRSGSDPLVHQNNEWNMEEFLFGGTHGSTGYNSDFNYDERLETISPPDYPLVKNDNLNLWNFPEDPVVSLNIYSFNEVSNELVLTDSLILSEHRYNLIDVISYENEIAFLLNSQWLNIDEYQIIRRISGEWSTVCLNLGTTDVESFDKYGNYYLIKVADNIFVYDETGLFVMEWSEGEIPSSTDYTDAQRGFLHYLTESGNDEYIYHVDELVQIDENVNLSNYAFEAEFMEELTSSEISVYNKANGEIVLQILEETENEGFLYPIFKNIYLASGDLAELPAEETDVPSVKLNLNVYPNPFNPSTNISFELAGSSFVHISIFNLKGQHVCDVKNEYMDAGKHTFSWDGSGVSSGMYMLRLESEFGREALKISLLK